MARTEYGCVIVVREAASMPGTFGQYSPWRVGVYKDAEVRDAPGCCAEVPGITIANEIDEAAFATCERPEMDWAAIPRADIYRFVFLHEAGHRVNNLSPAAMLLNDEFRSSAKRAALYRVNEALADRFAWSHLYPRRRFPRARLPRSYFKRLDQEMDELQRALPLTNPRVRTLPCKPGAYIPREHVEAGIPFRKDEATSQGAPKDESRCDCP